MAIPSTLENIYVKDTAGSVAKDPFSQGSMAALQPIASFDFKQSGPWGAQQPYLQDLFARARGLVGRGQDQASIASQGMRLDLANNLGGLLDYYGGGAANAYGGAMNTMGFLSNPNLLSPDSNPYLKMQGGAITQTVTDNLLRNILPELRSGAVNAGQYGGGSREGVAQGLAVGNTNTAISNALTNLYGGAYQQGLGTMLSAGGQLGQLAAMSPSLGTALTSMYAMPADLYAGVGREREMFPWWELNNYKGAIGGNYGEDSKEVKTDPGYKVGESIMSSLGPMLGGMMCWVADELYGVGSAKAKTLRAFVARQLGKPTKLGRFALYYLQHGRRWAEEIRQDAAKRARATLLWDCLYLLACEEK